MKQIGLLFFLLAIVYSSKGQNSDTSLISIKDFRLNSGTFSWRDGNSFHDMTRWDSSPYREGHLQQKSGSNWLFRMNYRLLFPNSYSANHEKGYPLLIMFHGAGERANCWVTNCYCTDCDPNAPEDGKANIAYLNNDHMLVHGGQPFMNAVNRAGSRKVGDSNLDPRAFPGFILFPQMENNWGSATSPSSTVAHALRILRLVIREYNIDPDRIYLAGLSMGGQAALKSLTMADWLFAAAICMSPVPFTRDFDYEGSANVPLWIFQGGKDQYPKPSQTEAFIRLFREAGGSVRYTFYEELGHNTWTRAFEEPEFFSWLLNFKKNALFRYFDTDYLCATSDEGLKLGMPAGFPAYQWQRNGATINEKNEHTLVVMEEGEYRGRFSRVENPGNDDWNEWSDVVKLSTYAPAAPELKHEGTTFLPDLNNSNEAVLYTEENYPYHYWERNGAAASLPDSNRVVFSSDNGSYAIRVSDYNKCPSPPSKSFPVFFNNQAPVNNIMRPETLTAEPMSSSSVLLNWSDAASEGGYEVWRRNSSVDGSRWNLARITGRDVTFLYDTALVPGSRYEYKIRGISNIARSDYFPSNNEADNVTTELPGGNDIPYPPQNVFAELVDVNKVKVTWEPGRDESGIAEYVVHAGDASFPTGSTDTEFFLDDLEVNRNYAVTVQTVDVSGNRSPHSNQHIVSTRVSGLFYRHSTGAWNSLADPAIGDTWTDPEYTGKVDNITLSPRVQDDYFNFEFNGYLKIDGAGEYMFYMNSDDGSQLFINDNMIIDYDGFHSTCQGDSQSPTCPNSWGKPGGPVTLSRGIHRLKIRFFQYTGGRNLVLRYAGRDTDFSVVTVPDGALTSGYAPVLNNPSAPSGLSGRAEGMQAIALQWRESSASDAQYEIYRGTATGGPFQIINRIGETSFTDTNLVPGMRYYYRLRAVTSSGSSGFTSVVGVSTDSDEEAPSAPQSLWIESGNLTKAILRWDASTDNLGVAAYEIWANGRRIGISPVPAFEATDLEPGEIYEFYVVAVDLAGNKSDESERVDNELFITASEFPSGGDFRLLVFPNPGPSQRITFLVTCPVSGPVEMRLTDLQSREIVSKSFQAIAGEDTQLSIERYLPNGLYVLSARIGAREMKRKVIIQND